MVGVHGEALILVKCRESEQISMYFENSERQFLAAKKEGYRYGKRGSHKKLCGVGLELGVLA